MKNIKILAITLALCVFNIACDNDGGDSVIELQNGALGNLTLADGTTTAIVNSTFATLDLKFSVDLAVGNPKSFDLKALYITIDGDVYGPVTLDAGVTTFPKDYVFSGAQIISAFPELNSVSDLNAGDNLYFYPSFTLNDGSVIDTLNSEGNANFYAPDFNQIGSNNYYLQYSVLCAPEPGVYTIDVHDAFADGWQTNDPNGGNGIMLSLDGVVTEFGMCSQYQPSPYPDCVGDLSNGTVTVTIPEGTEIAVWTFPGDAYNEISFEIYGPAGQLLLSAGPGTPAGPLAVVLCIQ